MATTRIEKGDLILEGSGSYGTALDETNFPSTKTTKVLDAHSIGEGVLRTQSTQLLADGFPQSGGGKLVIDSGGASEEFIDYSTHNQSTFTLVGTLTKTHAAGENILLRNQVMIPTADNRGYYNVSPPNDVLVEMEFYTDAWSGFGGTGLDKTLYGILLRKSGNNYYFLGVKEGTSPKTHIVVIEKITAGTSTELANAKQSSFLATSGKFTLLAQAKGTQLTATLLRQSDNQTLSVSTADSSYSSGFAGFDFRAFPSTGAVPSVNRWEIKEPV